MGDISLSWVPANAPYMPVASIGLLGAIKPADPTAALVWTSHSEIFPPSLELVTALDLGEIAQAVHTAPWPDIDSLPWPAPRGQAIKPTLAKAALPSDEPGSSPVRQWRRLAGLDGASPPESPELRQAQRLVAALLTDGAIDDAGLPGRSRLLRGVKADLSGVAKPPKMTVDELAQELAVGPTWTSGSSGLGLGVVPEVQTFGGTTGPDPSSVGSYSRLLYRLCWLGIITMPPFAVLRGSRRVVGGPLFSGPDTLSWPIWNFPLRQDALVTLFGLNTIHEPEPDRRVLRARGIDAVFRSQARSISTMLSVFGTGDRVA